ncbi:hypothetical protein OHB49_04060 [Streptomyces sp. NBC_01717]|nr:hypothetical protein [Streptomyces sp. NBC_01717]
MPLRLVAGCGASWAGLDGGTDQVGLDVSELGGQFPRGKVRPDGASDGGESVFEADMRHGQARAAGGVGGQMAQDLVDAEHGPQFVLNQDGAVRAQGRSAPAALLDLDVLVDRFAGPAGGVQLGKLAGRGLHGVEQRSDQPEHLRGLLDRAVRAEGGRGDRVLDDPYRIRSLVPLPRSSLR